METWVVGADGLQIPANCIWTLRSCSQRFRKPARANGFSMAGVLQPEVAFGIFWAFWAVVSPNTNEYPEFQFLKMPDNGPTERPQAH